MKRRTYQQYCGVAKALDLVGERWTLLIARNLLLGPQSYSALLQGLPGITTNLLAKRLRELEEHGIIEKHSNGYVLTAHGQALEPVVLALGKWGWRTMGVPKRGETLNVGWAMLSLKNRYKPGVPLSSEWRIQDGNVERTFELALGETSLVVQERSAALPQVRLEGPLGAFRAFMFRETALTETDIVVTGREQDARELASRFVGMRYS